MAGGPGRHRIAGWRPGAIIAAAGVLLIAIATLTPGASNVGVASQVDWCVGCVAQSLADFVVNVALFMPLAFGLRLAGKSLVVIVVSCFVCTCVVEAMQALVIRGRDPALSDVIANTIGGLLGGAIALPLSRIPSVAWSRALWCLALGAWTVAVVVSSWSLMLRPARGTLDVQNTPRHEGRDWFRGQVLAAKASLHQAHGGGTISGSLGERTDTMRLDVRFISGRPVVEASTIAGVSDRYGPLVWIAQDGRDIVLEEETLGTLYSLRAPRAVVRGVIPERPSGSDTLEATAMAGRWGIRLSVASASGTFVDEVRTGPTRGWVLLAPSLLATARYATLITILFGVLLTIPVGYLAVLATKRGASPVVPVVISIVVVAATTLLLVSWQRSSSGVSEVLGPVCGLVLGVVAARARLRQAGVAQPITATVRGPRRREKAS